MRTAINYTKNHSSKMLFEAGCFLGILVFLLLYGFSPLDITNDVWLRGGYIEADIQQHYAGWLFYRDAPLSVPFGIAPTINWPDGMSIAFTDSIPLFATIFRLLSPLLPATFQYFGWFTLICFALQGGFAALLMGLFTSRFSTAMVGTIPFVFSPILLERAFRHTALGAHFFILGALYYYIRGRREGRFNYIGLFILNCAVLAIHPYFAPMTYALTFALLLEHAILHRQIGKPILFLVSNLVGTAAVSWLFGLFSGGSASSGGSGIQYGHFCMNLNALWNPSSRNMPSWSLFLPQQNQVLGNYDGFNYLGLGILLCSIFLIVLLGIRLFKSKFHYAAEILQQRFGLIFVCLCLSMFAVSHVITANGRILAQLPLPQFIIQIATTLRSSGRLFWPVYYLIFLSCIVTLLRFFRNRGKCTSLIALSIFCAVQLIDLSPALIEKAQSFRPYRSAGYNLLNESTENGLSAFWNTVSQNYDHLIALDPLQKAGLSLALASADAGMTSSDTSFTARFNEEQAQLRREDSINKILSGNIPADTLFFTEQEQTFLTLAETAQQQGAWCGVIQQTAPNGDFAPLLYVIAPGLQYSDPLALEFSDNFPLHIADYSDDYWDHGILSLNLESIGREKDKNKVVLFYDTPYIRRKLNTASALTTNDGFTYPILEINDKDAGWLMVTLDIDDAHQLYNENGQCKDLES